MQERNPSPPQIVLTVGHSNRSLEEFLQLLQAHGVTLVADVRKMPGSRRNPQFGRDILARALRQVGIGYLHMPGLGGLRHPRPDSPNAGWKNASFQGYADYMLTPARTQPHVLRPWAGVQDGHLVYPPCDDAIAAVRRTTMIKLKRAYEDPSPDDGTRILVERLWPRGLSKERAALHLWLKEVAPSTELRKWFGHDPARWEQFQERYRQELRENRDAVKLLRQKVKEGTVTLVYAARDEQHNGAVVLKRFLQGH
jgi:uncharacterized protein YeaO (DUF488 family)